MGRTNKAIPSGIKNGPNFDFVNTATYEIDSTAFNARSNIQSRYPVHGHFMGSGRAQVPLIRDCHIEDSPGWLAVHHGCETDWFDNTLYKFGGSGFVAETGDEIGAWVGNLSFSYTGTLASHSTPKTSESVSGAQEVDFGRRGAPFFMRGRALRLNGNIAASGTWGFVFYHRGGTETINNFVNLRREHTDLNDLAPLRTAGEINTVDYPIVHFADNEVFGCYGGFFVTKANPAQYHDLNINLKRFKAWGVAQGGNIQYVGKYAATDWDLVGVRESEIPANYPETTTACELGPNGQQIAFIRGSIQAFQRALLFTTSQIYSPISAWNDTDNPMFMVVATTFIGNDTDHIFSGGADTVTRFFATEPSYQEVSTNIPFMIGAWNGNGGTAGATMTELPVGLIKTDTVGDQTWSGVSADKTWGDIGNAWDPAGLSNNRMGSELDNLLETYGFQVIDGMNYVTFVNYYSDRLTTRPIKKLHGARIDASVSGMTNNGTLTLSTTIPSCDDITQSVLANSETIVDVLSLATVEPGATAELDTAYYAPDHGRAVLQNGTVVYKPDPNFVGEGEMYVWVTDGQGGYKTVKIDFEVTGV